MGFELTELSLQKGRFHAVNKEVRSWFEADNGANAVESGIFLVLLVVFIPHLFSGGETNNGSDNQQGELHHAISLLKK